MKLCELDSVYESKELQRLHRPSILCNSRLVIYSGVRYLFVLRAGETVFLAYVVSVFVVSLELVGLNL